MLRTLRFIVVVSAALIGTAPVLAQSNACQRYRMELTEIEQGGGVSSRGQQFEAAAERQRFELSRMENYYRSLGCAQSGFSMFNAPPPPQCGSLGAKLRQMQANFSQLSTQAERMGGGAARQARREELRLAIRQLCQPEEAARPRGLLESLFGGRPQLRNRPPEAVQPEEIEERWRSLDDEDNDKPRGVGGSRPICVRACDGYFFPLTHLPNGRESADEMCKALCPGAEASAYFMPGGGNGRLEQAVAGNGEGYSSLANAFRYQKTFDATCSCRRAGDSWMQALRAAEEMIERRKSDILVTTQKSDELSRPKSPGNIKETGKKTKKDKANALPIVSPPITAIETEAAAALGAAAPTAGLESSGIGPQQIEGEKVLGRNSGEQEVVNVEGKRKNVRIVAPGVIGPPQNSTE